MREIKSEGGYRILEVLDECSTLEDLKGDMFNPTSNPDIDPSVLIEEEREFEKTVEREGVYGYELQEWDPCVGCGWETISSCYGFIGDSKNEHYIVNELWEHR